MTDNVKYPSQPTYTATVANEETLLTGSRQDNSNCGAKCFMTVVSLVFLLLGLAMSTLAVYTLVVLTYGGQNVLTGYSMATVYALLVVGLVLLVLSLAVLISSCKPNNCCSKFILTLFSIVMVLVFIVQVALIILGCMWLYGVQDNTVNADALFNESVQELYNVCCVASSNETGTDVCDHVLGNHMAADCASETSFYEAVVSFVTPMLKWVFGFLGVVAVLNIIAFACSCCLICSRKRSRAIYKPAVTYQNGV